MKKAAAKPDVTTTAGRDVDQYLAVFEARRQFLDMALGMSWRLAFTVLVPVIIGVKLDNHFHTAPAWTLTALFVAVAGAVAIVWSTLKSVSKVQLEESKGKKKL